MSSPILADGGAQVGKLPGSIPLHDLLDLGCYHKKAARPSGYNR